MKRLTERTDIGDSPLDAIAFINPDDAGGMYNLRDIGEYGSDELLLEIANRLAEYEDMEEQGLLVRLPCKVGDTIYRCGDPIKKIYEWQIAYVEVYEDETVFVDDSDNTFVEADIGKTVFLTHEEAERALEEVWNRRTGEEGEHD